MLDVAQELTNLQEIVILGDFADFYSVQSYQKEADQIGVKLEYEVEFVNEILDDLDTLFPKIKKVYIEGNHEYRLARYIEAKAPDLFGLVNCEALFNLEKRSRYTWIPYGPYQLYKTGGSKLYARHEPLGGGVNHARLSVIKGGCSMVYGHVHVYQSVQSVNLEGQAHRAFCPGWLGPSSRGLSENPGVFRYVKNHAQWTQGFSIVTVLQNGHWFADDCQIVDYTTVFGGEVYKR